MKRLIAACFLCAVPAVVYAQPKDREEPQRGAFYLELAHGNAMVLLCCSINVELNVKPRTFVRIGVGGAILNDCGIPMMSSLIMINRLVGGNGRYVELGAGSVRSNTGYPPAAIARLGPTVTLGYRAVHGSRIRRLTFTPMLGPFADRWTSGRHFVPAVGFSDGFSF